VEAVERRLAELVAQKDWRLLETGRFLHDDLGQLLTAAGIHLDLIASQLRKDASAEAVEAVVLLQDLLEQSMVRVRSLSEDLNKSTADRLGLKPAIERLIEKWDPALNAPIQFLCPPRLKLSLLQSRAVIGMLEFAFELAANSLSCRRVEVKARVTARKCVVAVHLIGVNDPHREPENEVRWRILKASAALAGGGTEISVAFRTEDVTIMRAEFPTKFPTEFSTGAAAGGAKQSVLR
jgi:nitrate/nitrite-specific signal transduction histidine kinase